MLLTQIVKGGGTEAAMLSLGRLDASFLLDASNYTDRSSARKAPHAPLAAARAPYTTRAACSRPRQLPLLPPPRRVLPSAVSVASTASMCCHLLSRPPPSRQFTTPSAPCCVEKCTLQKYVVDVSEIRCKCFGCCKSRSRYCICCNGLYMYVVSVCSQC
jgi:hypothetical protein